MILLKDVANSWNDAWRETVVTQNRELNSLHKTKTNKYRGFISSSPENSVFPKVLFSVAFVCWVGFFFGGGGVYNTTVFIRIIQDTPNKLSGIICRPPEQIKLQYHDSNSLLWLDKSKKPILYLDLNLEHSMPSRSLDELSETLQHVYSWGVTLLTRNIQDTSTKLSVIICRPPEQIKF